MKLFFGLLVLSAAVSLVAYYQTDVLVPLAERFFGEGEDPIPTIRVQTRDVRLAVQAEGELVGLKAVPIRVPQVRTGSLNVAWLREEGAFVEEGEPIIRFDSSDALLSLEESKNQYSRFGYRIEQTSKDSEGRQEVLEKDQESAALERDFADSQIRKDETVFSAWEIEESVVSAALAAYRQKTLHQREQLEEKRSKAEIEILGINRQDSAEKIGVAQETLSSLQLRAPAAGILLHMRRRFEKLEVGAQVWAREQILEIVDLGQFRAQVQMQEKDIAGIRTGAPVKVELKAYPDREISARISRISRVARQIYRIDPRKYFDCDLVLDVPEDLIGQLKPGLKLMANVEIDHWEDAVLLPRSALIEKDETFVAFVERDGVFTETPVNIIATDHGFGVVDGLNPGEVVALRNPYAKEELTLPDINALSAATRGRRFIIQ